MAGTCSPVDQMHIIALPVIATLTMVANRTKTNSIGLQLQAECWYEQEELPQASSYYISDHKKSGQRKPRKRRSDEVLCLDKPVLLQEGVGGCATFVLVWQPGTIEGCLWGLYKGQCRKPVPVCQPHK